MVTKVEGEVGDPAKIAVSPTAETLAQGLEIA